MRRGKVQGNFGEGVAMRPLPFARVPWARGHRRRPRNIRWLCVRWQAVRPGRLQCNRGRSRCHDGSLPRRRFHGLHRYHADDYVLVMLSNFSWWTERGLLPNCFSANCEPSDGQPGAGSESVHAMVWCSRCLWGCTRLPEPPRT